MANLEALEKELSDLTVVEALTLAKRLSQVWGVSLEATPSPVAIPVETKVEIPVEQTEFKVTLVSFGDTGNKIKVIQGIRPFTGLALKEAKELVERAPSILKDSATKEEANKIRDSLEALGATIKIE